MGMLDGWLFKPKDKKGKKPNAEALARIEKAHQAKAEERERIHQVKLRELSIRERKVDLEEKRLDVEASRLDRDKAKYDCEADEYYPEDLIGEAEDFAESPEDKFIEVATRGLLGKIKGIREPNDNAGRKGAVEQQSTKSIAPEE